MNNQLLEKWDRIYAADTPTELQAISVLTENYYLLPGNGAALDLACGLGANALFLAEQGLSTEAWDISQVALDKLQLLANERCLNIETIAREITPQSLVSDCFDVIVVSRFLDRSICNAIMASLRPGGLLFYQTFTQQKITEQGPKSSRFLLADNELLRLFSRLKLIYYRENSGLGSLDQGLRNEAQYIGQKI